MPVCHGGAQQRRELEGPCHTTGEQLRVQHRDAAVGQGGRAWLTVTHLSVDQIEVPDRVMGRVVCKHQMSQPGNRPMQHAEVVIGPDVTIDD
ncbi:hypothetical protein D3C84_861710 [compost metagenome]